MLVAFAGSYANLHAASVPSSGTTVNQPTSFVGVTPTLRYSRSITDRLAASFLGEAGPRNFRANGTVGWDLQENQRIKFSGEFLNQDIEYAFYSGKVREWVHQGAIGGYYQYDLHQYDWNQYNFFPELTLQGGYSHAPNKRLSSKDVVFTTATNGPETFTFSRGIAGSNAWYLAPGVNVHPWQGSKAGVELNYDNVHYTTQYISSDNAKGVGATFRFNQAFKLNTTLDLIAGIRAPFNDYQAVLMYAPTRMPDWAFGLDGAYVDGKHNLPNTYNVGVRVHYTMKDNTSSAVPSVSALADSPSTPLVDWVSEPAIYIPQVLAVVDPQVVSRCIARVGRINGPIIVENGPPPGKTTLVPTASAFASSEALVYSYTTTGNLRANTVSIDSSTGVVSIFTPPTGASTDFRVYVTATNACGSVSTSFLVRVLGSI